MMMQVPPPSLSLSKLSSCVNKYMTAFGLHYGFEDCPEDLIAVENYIPSPKPVLC